MKDKVKTAYKLLATAIIKSGCKEYDEEFLNGEWVENLYELSGSSANDYNFIIEYGKVNKEIKVLTDKIKYNKRIGADYSKAYEKRAKLWEEREKLKKHKNKC